jgi:uncharacterized membrane protein YqjE
MSVSGSHDSTTDPRVTTGATAPTGTSAPGGEDRSLGELLGDIANNMTTLVKDELELAKTEAKQEAAKAGKGAGLLGGAGVTGHLALLFGSLALMYLLDTWMHTALAALIVTVIWAIVAAVLAQKGRKELKGLNPKLETTQRTIKEDVQWAKQQKNS